MVYIYSDLFKNNQHDSSTSAYRAR